MSMLLLQTFLLMLTAFFLGALVACLVKSTFFDVAADQPAQAIPIPAPIAQPRPASVMPQPPPRPAPEAVRPKIETVARPVSAPSMPLPDAQRFERALKEQTAASVTAATPPASTQAATPASAPKPPVTVTTAPIVPATPAAPVVAPPAPAAARPSTAVPAVPRVEVKQPEPLKPAVPAASPPAAAATVSAPQPVPTPAPAPAPAPAVRLDLGSAAAVAAAAAMAAARARPAEAAPKVEAAPARPAPVTVTPPSAVAPAPAPRPIMPAAAGSSGPASVSAQVSMPAPADDLTHIRAIDTALQGRLNALGVRRFEDIARWSAADVQRLRADSGIGARVATENWIEQAQILAKGGTTEYARRRAAAGKGVAMAAPSPNVGVAAPLKTSVAAPLSAPASAPAPVKAVEAAPKPVAAAPAPSAPATPAFELPRSGAQAAAAAAAAIAAAAAASARRSEAATTPPAPSTATTAAAPGASSVSAPGAVAARDDLQRIHGINAEVEKLLNAQGVTRFTQITGWSAADTDRFNGLLGTPGRISRENWIEQAAVLASGTAGTYARRSDLASRPVEADASRPARLADALRERESASKAPEPQRAPAAARPDLSNLRSVRSEALRGDVAGSGAAVDDLKRIRGIGVLIEKKLNSLGVSSYEQVANWTGADIDRISQILDFKGRIERENWVEQSRILASGGQTEFSRRVDKGDA